MAPGWVPRLFRKSPGSILAKATAAHQRAAGRECDLVAPVGRHHGPRRARRRSAVGKMLPATLLFAPSMSTIPADLAGALARRGALSAMELDINPEWVQLDTARTQVARSPPRYPARFARPAIASPAGPGTSSPFSARRRSRSGGTLARPRTAPGSAGPRSASKGQRDLRPYQAGDWGGIKYSQRPVAGGATGLGGQLGGSFRPVCWTCPPRRRFRPDQETIVSGSMAVHPGKRCCGRTVRSPVEEQVRPQTTFVAGHGDHPRPGGPGVRGDQGGQPAGVPERHRCCRACCTK